MKVSKSWLNELVNINKGWDELEELISLKTVGVDKQTEKYIELDMKGHHRADLLSLRGVALEVAAILESQVNFEDQDIKLTEQGDIHLEVTDVKNSPLYCLVKIKGLEVGSSPPEWVEKLEDSGLRSVNNIADVTNLIMLEYGQPMHAFDASAVKDEKIIVREAKKGEELITLDDKKRALVKGDILITDREKVLGLAGVMGGKNSEVIESTKDILLEAAIFDPKALRATSQRLGLVSEASRRFYHGLTKKRLFQALEAAIKMYQELGGRVVGMAVKDNFEDQPRKIIVREEKVKALIGVDIPKGEQQGFLQRLNFNITEIDDKSWEVAVPYWRLDVGIEEDVVEEIARMYGYENIPAKPLKGNLPSKIDQSLFELINQIKTALMSLGLTEVRTYSYYSTQTLDALGFKDAQLKSLVKIANPISSETEYLRQTIWANLIEVISKNIKQGFEDIAIFEIGKSYWPKKEGKPEEKYGLGIALMNGTDNPVLELNQLFEKLNENLLNLKIHRVEPPKVVSGIFHPQRFYSISLGGKMIGGMAQVHPKVLFKYRVEKHLAVLEIELTDLLKLH